MIKVEMISAIVQINWNMIKIFRNEHFKEPKEVAFPNSFWNEKELMINAGYKLESILIITTNAHANNMRGKLENRFMGILY